MKQNTLKFDHDIHIRHVLAPVCVEYVICYCTTVVYIMLHFQLFCLFRALPFQRGTDAHLCVSTSTTELSQMLYPSHSCVSYGCPGSNKTQCTHWQACIKLNKIDTKIVPNPLLDITWYTFVSFVHIITHGSLFKNIQIRKLSVWCKFQHTAELVTK